MGKKVLRSAAYGVAGGSSLLGATRCPDCSWYVPRNLYFDDGKPLWVCPNCGVLHEDHRWYVYVTQEEATEIIEHRGRRGLFVQDTGVEFIGIDNRDGDAWVEEFPDLIECLMWLADVRKE